MNNAEEFLSIFNEIENELRKRLDGHDYHEFSSVLKELEYVKKDRVIARFAQDLREYAELRNAIVHKYNHRAIAEPYPETVAGIKKLRDLVLQPKTARDIMTSNVVTFALDDRIDNAIRQMQENILTNVPVLEDSKIVGILSEESCLRWLAHEYRDDGFISSAVVIRDMSEYLDNPAGDKYSRYKYISPKVDVYTINDMFNDAIFRGERLAAIFVTEHGKQDEAILGIITSWDLHRV